MLFSLLSFWSMAQYEAGFQARKDLLIDWVADIYGGDGIRPANWKNCGNDGGGDWADTLSLRHSRYLKNMEMNYREVIHLQTTELVMLSRSTQYSL